MRQRWRQFQQFLGPYQYAPGFIIGCNLVLSEARLRPFTYLYSAGYKRVHFFLLGTLVILILVIPVYLSLKISQRFWRARRKTRTYYLIEITTTVMVYNICEYLASKTLIPLFKIRDFLLMDDFMSIFALRLIFGVLFVAVTHSRARDLQARLTEAEELNISLTQRYSALIETDEEIRDQAAKLLHDRIQSELMLAASRLTKASQTLPAEAQAEILPVIKVLEKIRGTDIRQVSQLLTPNLTGEGLLGSCETLCENFSTAIEIQLDIESAIEVIGENTKLGIYRIIEQGLTNSIKHGPAENVTISVRKSQTDELVIRISDDGPGSESASSGKGTQIIDAWVAILGGSKEIESSPGKGYTLRVTLPAERA